uniref:Uncharacterized protein n=1 Tax=Rhizophora mucronata TaxID=61149 RepID=A0A2P2P990_RHIMU
MRELWPNVLTQFKQYLILTW